MAGTNLSDYPDGSHVMIAGIYRGEVIGSREFAGEVALTVRFEDGTVTHGISALTVEKTD
jgi:hypothetical protein